MPSPPRQSNFPPIGQPAELVPDPDVGRHFSGRTIVRVDAVDRSGRLRFDGLARYVQDTAADDSADSGLPTTVTWVIRRSVVEVYEPITFREQLTLTTFCSGIGRGWAERRMSIRGDRGGHAEYAAIWVALDRASGAPRRVPEGFEAVYGESTLGRKVRPTLIHPPPPPAAEEMPWVFRATDFDVLDHVNNAVYWAPLEELFAGANAAVPALRFPSRGEVEYRQPIEPGDRVTVHWAATEDQLGLWLVGSGDQVYASVAWSASTAR